MNRLKVLIVEDEEAMQFLWRAEIEEKIGDDVEVLQAFTKEEGDLLLDAHAPDLAVMVVDACVPGKEPNTIGLVEKARKLLGAHRPIIAVSGNEEFQRMLETAGCNYVCPQKHNLLCPEKQKLSQMVADRLLELSDARL